MDDFEQLGVTAIAEFPAPSRPARSLAQLVTVIVAGMALTAIAILAFVAVAAEVTTLLNAPIGIQ